MIVDDYCAVRWMFNNKEYYQNKGYIFTELGDTFKVTLEDLDTNSAIVVRITCDDCGKATKRKIAFYYRTVDRDGTYLCATCRRGDRLLDLVYVRSEFELRDYTLLETVYKNCNTKMNYTCNKHPYKIQSITFHNLLEEHGCRECHREELSARQQNGNHWNYKGGVTGISHHLRRFIFPWQKKSLQEAKYKCFVTGMNGEFHIHHLTPFNQLVLLAHETKDIPIKRVISDYTDEELTLLEHEILRVHLEGQLGVVLLNKVHKKFHKIYGKLNNTTEQLEEFKQRYLKGELY